MTANEAKRNIFYYYNVVYVLLNAFGLMADHKQKLLLVTFGGFNLCSFMFIYNISHKKSDYHA